MKKNLFSLWVFLLAVFFVTNVNAQVTIGNLNGKPKAAEKFSALEVISNGTGGLRLPQLTTAQRNTLDLASVSDVNKKMLTKGLTIFNLDTKCVEYWNNTRWISMCDGTSQTTISPEPCKNVAADGSGCDQQFTVTDPDCPNGPFTIAIVAGNDYATLTNVNGANGTYKINFKDNSSVAARTVIVRVLSSCTNQYKDFMYTQNGVDCAQFPFTAPTISSSPSGANLTLCSGGGVYLSVPATTADLDKLIWTRNSVEVARGVSYLAVTQPGTYNISMGAAGCNEISSNERIVKESGTAPAAISTIIASNNGIICTGSTITLTALGASGSVAWFKNGVLTSKTGTKITLSDTDTGKWFAVANSGDCYSKPSNEITATVSSPTGTPITVAPADVLVNGKALTSVTKICAGGSLTLEVKNQRSDVTYTWYNGDTPISSPYTVPTDQASMLLRMVAKDNTGAACPVEMSSSEITVTNNSTPGIPTIKGAGVICDDAAILTLVPQETTSTFTYQWYKNGVLLPDTGVTLSVTDPGAVITATVTNETGCTSGFATKTIATEISSLPVLSWVTTDSNAIYGDVKTFTAGVINTPVTFVWSADSGATVKGTGATVSVTFPTSGDKVTLKGRATNSCGFTDIEKEIAIREFCPDPILTAGSQTSFSSIAGPSVTIHAVATLTAGTGNRATYQWYKSATASTSGGTAISGATLSQIDYIVDTVGTTYLYCIVTNGCGTFPKATSPFFTVVGMVNPATLAIGAGTLTGKTCFDINMSNDGDICGAKAGRATAATNFKTDNQFDYVFTRSGAITNLRFVVVDPDGAVASTNADAVAVPGSVGAATVTLNVTYKNTLNDANDIVYGKTSDNAVNVKIYAVYTIGTTDYAVPISIKIQDCVCCGAYIAPNVWRNFMCRNLGADPNLDYTVMKPELVGKYYVMGNDKPSKNSSGAVISTAQGGGIIYGGGVFDFVSWKTSVGANKAPKDPCPVGYRVPTLAEWKGVINNNTYTKVTNTIPGNPTYTGTKFGQSLYLPWGVTFTTGGPAPDYSILGYLGSVGTLATPKTNIPLTLIQTNAIAPVISDDQSSVTFFITQHPVRCIEQL